MVLKNGSKGDDVLKLQKGLASLGFLVGTPDGAFGPNTENAVEDFQNGNDLLADGIVGGGTLGVYNPKVSAEFQIVVAPQPDPVAPPASGMNTWATVACDKYKDGFGNTTLRNDLAVTFAAMHAEVVSLGGKLTSAGGKRPLSAGGGAAQSKTSMHYIGRAHDMALSSGMQNPLTDPIVAVKHDPSTPFGVDRHWVVWMRTSNPAVPLITLQGVQCKTVSGKTVLSIVPVTDRFFNFTELAAKYGWTNIGARKFFFQGGSYAGAEWWHFQNTSGLVKGVTTFGSELMRLYSPQECKALAWWDEVKDAVFGEDFN